MQSGQVIVVACFTGLGSTYTNPATRSYARLPRHTAGIASNLSTHYGWGYQLVDNYLVRVLAGKSAWDLPPGNITKEELQVGRGLLVMMQWAECVIVDRGWYNTKRKITVGT